MACLPHDILGIILSYLHYCNLIACERVSVDVRQVLTRKKLWCDLLQYAYPCSKYDIDDPRHAYEYLAHCCFIGHNVQEVREKEEAQYGRSLSPDQCPPEECRLCGWKRDPKHVRQSYNYVAVPRREKDPSEIKGIGGFYCSI